MHLPAPLRAAVGLVATARDEARHLPDRAIELPMLAVSTALQASLRVQQRYARLAARGDEVLNRRPPSSTPPPWATFDDPVDVVRPAGNETLFAAQDYAPDELEVGRDPSAVDEHRAALDENVVPQGSPVPTEPESTKAKPETVAKAPKAAKKQTAKTAKVAKASKTTKKQIAGDKTISKPRHATPSAFDNVPDDAD